MTYWPLPLRKHRESPQCVCAVGTFADKHHKAKLALGLALLLSSLNVTAEALKHGMPFYAAVRLIQRQHWQPFDVHRQYNYQHIGMDSKLYQLGFKAVESCSFEQSICVFNYRKNNRCLRLTSIGEKVKAMTVYQWSYQCPQYSQ
jgi:hypothetical protein